MTHHTCLTATWVIGKGCEVRMKTESEDFVVVFSCLIILCEASSNTPKTLMGTKIFEGISSQ